MTLQQKNKLKQLHNKWKQYYSLIAILLTFLGLSWEISHAAYTVVHSDLQELHTTSATVTTIQKERNAEFLNKEKRIEARDNWDKRQDADINKLKYSMGIVKDRLHIADEE